jgi:hypothetical protein
MANIFRRLKQHDTSCSFHIHSGDRHCSCGRDMAIKELLFIQRLLFMLIKNHDNQT